GSAPGRGTRSASGVPRWSCARPPAGRPRAASATGRVASPSALVGPAREGRPGRDGTSFYRRRPGVSGPAPNFTLRRFDAGRDESYAWLAGRGGGPARTG